MTNTRFSSHKCKWTIMSVELSIIKYKDLNSYNLVIFITRFLSCKKGRR